MAEFGQLPGQNFYLELSIGDERYNPNNIQYLIIREWIFNILPTIELQIVDEGYLTEVVPMQDQEDIEVVLGKHEDDENPLEMTFSLDDYTVGIAGDNRRSIITITGHLKVDDMFVLKTRSFSRRNSSSVLSNIASEAGLTFRNPHNIIPSDNMVWYQASLSNLDFIKHVLKRSYLPDDVMFFYANSQSEFILTSLNSEISKRESSRAKFSVENYERNAVDEDDPDDTIWFNSYNIVNYSGYFNKKMSYGVTHGYYDLENNSVYNIYSNINRSLTDLSFRNSSLAGEPVKCSDCGGGDFIERNIYGVEYFESLARNKFLKQNFFANSVVLNINALSQVNLMDTIDVDIPSLISFEQSNEVMSGFYLVAGVQHEISNGSTYRKKIAISRNGMNRSPDVNFYEVES